MENLLGNSMMERIAQISIKAQKAGPEDYVDDEGLLRCGVCGERKRSRKLFPAPNAEDPDRQIELVVGVMCKCAREKAEQEKAKEQAAKDMEVIASLRNASLISEKFSGASFADFEVSKHNEWNFKLCKRYVTAWDKMFENNQGLLFWGDVGTGKSYAAACIANELLAQRVPVIMTSLVKLLELIERDRDAEASIINRICKAKLVVFDDLGAERSTNYGLEKVYNIIDSRYRSGLPMILTTNLDIETMKNEIDIRYSRIYDRIFETCYPARFTGPSWRRKSASRRFHEMEQLLGMDGGE